MTKPNHATICDWADAHMDEILDALDSGERTGFCVMCGYEEMNADPDSSHQHCPECKSPGIFGAQELVFYMSEPLEMEA